MPVVMRRPERWDHPFDPELQDAHLEELLALEPWAAMRRDKPDKIGKILLHDARLLDRTRGEIVVREGDYGNSAFFIISGSVRVVVEKPGLTPAEEGKVEVKRKGLLGALAQLWRNRREPEARENPSKRAEEMRRQGSHEDYVPIILKDVDVVLDRRRTALLHAGEVFGEIAALGRTPRTASVFAAENGTRLLEIRWQGLRDLRRQFPAFKEHVDARFRGRALRQHMRAAPVFRHVGDTPEIREHLRQGTLQELFVDSLGFARPGKAHRPIALGSGGDQLRLEPLALSRTRDDAERVTVFSCDASKSRIADNVAQRDQVLVSLGKRTGGHLIVIFTGLARGARLWQWRIAEPDQSQAHGMDYLELPKKDPAELLARLIRGVALDEIGRQAEFHSYGTFDASQKSQGIASEPVIAAEGQYPNGIILLRAGFARVTGNISGDERTFSYLGPGRAYGFDEIATNWKRPEQPVPFQRTLRAVGYVDTVAIPTAAIEKYVLPSLPESELPPQLPPRSGGGTDPLAALRDRTGVDRSLVEFLVDNRFTNGTAAMVIDLERCTRCDDCVRACASAHDDNPRFLRHGPRQGRFMIANACMHCADPVCMIGCPTGAISRDLSGGQVVINDATCIGCASCANNCPYFNIRMAETRSSDGAFYVDARNQPHRKATKCDLCSDQMGGPACQRACPHEALRRLDLTDVAELARWAGR